MTIKEYVDDVLCAPVTRIGNKYIVEAIELVLDTKDHKFYKSLCKILQVTPQYLEKALRDAKIRSLEYMNSDIKQDIFGKDSVTTTEYIIKATEYYRRNYGNKG